MGGTFDMVRASMVGAEYIVFTVGKVLVGGVRTCTLLGPEGPDVSGLWVGCSRTSGPFLVHRRCWWVGGGTARTLRTTQWTRASSRRPFGRFVIDDLIDH